VSDSSSYKFYADGGTRTGNDSADEGSDGYVQIDASSSASYLEGQPPGNYLEMQQVEDYEEPVEPDNHPYLEVQPPEDGLDVSNSLGDESKA